jgi:hypothetical protein
LPDIRSDAENYDTTDIGTTRAIVGSVMLSCGAFAILMEPRLAVLYPAYMIPMFLFEIGGGLWLLIKGLRPPSPAS